MTICTLRSCCSQATGPLLLAVAVLLASGAAQAQLNPQELLKQVLPGTSEGSDSSDSDAASERACQRYAEKQGLDVRKVRDTRSSGKNNVEVTLSVQDRHDRYDARCIYDTDDQEVRELTRMGTSKDAAGDSGVDERLATRAQDACEQLAEDRNLEDVDFGAAHSRGPDTVEIELRAKAHGKRQNLSCLYDAEQRHAVLAE